MPKPRDYELNPRGHRWQTFGPDDPEIDTFAYNPEDSHNGPRCVKCGYEFCHHCQDGPDEDCPTPD